MPSSPCCPSVSCRLGCFSGRGTGSTLAGVRIDLHTHSTASDGTDSPAALVSAAAAAGLDVVALTDHDSSAGWAEASEAATSHHIALVPGIEISTRLGGASVHLLGYLLDPTYEPLQAELELILQARDARLSDILERLQLAGVVIREEDVRRHAGRALAVGRPHVADALVASGVVASRDEAFSSWLDKGRPGYVSRYATATTTMVELVTAAGGVAVVAHPWGRGSRDVIDTGAVETLAAAGLAGLEVHHHDHGDRDSRALESIATGLDLVVTGSSDYHGRGKVNHELGSHVTGVEEYERLLDRARANALASGRDVATVVGG